MKGPAILVFLCALGIGLAASRGPFPDWLRVVLGFGAGCAFCFGAYLWWAKP